MGISTDLLRQTEQQLRTWSIRPPQPAITPPKPSQQTLAQQVSQMRASDIISPRNTPQTAGTKNIFADVAEGFMKTADIARNRKVTPWNVAKTIGSAVTTGVSAPFVVGGQALENLAAMTPAKHLTAETPLGMLSLPGLIGFTGTMLTPGGETGKAAKGEKLLAAVGKKLGMKPEVLAEGLKTGATPLFKSISRKLTKLGMPIEKVTQATKGVEGVTPKVLAAAEKETGVLANKPPIGMMAERVGAVSNEMPAGLKERGFITTVKEGERTAPEVAGNLQVAGEATKYKPIPNVQALKEAETIIARSPDEAKVIALTEDSPRASMAGQLLIEKAQNENRYDDALELVHDLSKVATEKGQFNQALSYWGRLSPVGIVRFAEKEFAKANESRNILDRMVAGVTKGKIGGKVTITEDLIRQITAEAKRLQGLPENAKKIEASKNLLQTISDQIPPGVSEMFDSFRYQNMLSGPQTQERNIGSNLFQTFITRPADLAFSTPIDWVKSTLFGRAREYYAGSVPQYYKEVLNSIPNAWTAAKEVFRNPGQLRKPDLTAIRVRSMPKGLTIVPRFMEAADKFNSTLIAAGERARLLGNGIDAATAEKQAFQLAEEYLFRFSPGAKANEPVFARALDAVSDVIGNLRKAPVIGGAASWMVPFLRTPIIWARTAVTHSPLGFVGGSYSTEQMAKATFGSTMMGLGALYAGQGKTTFSVPTDPKARQYFYDSGKKPYSVLLGNKWVPAWYLGPLGFAFMIPSAYKWYNDEAATAPTASGIDKLTTTVVGLTHYLASQTPLQGVNNFFNLLEGSTDYNMASSLGFTAGQVVPFSGFLRQATKVLDDVYRKPEGFGESIIKDIPILSKRVAPYTTAKGELSKREKLNIVLPYELGTEKPSMSKLLQGRYKKLQQNRIKAANKKGKTTPVPTTTPQIPRRLPSL